MACERISSALLTTALNALITLVPHGRGEMTQLLEPLRIIESVSAYPGHGLVRFSFGRWFRLDLGTCVPHACRPSSALRLRPSISFDETVRRKTGANLQAAGQSPGTRFLDGAPLNG